MAQHVFRGTGAPTFAPTQIGQHYIDTANKLTYVSAGTSSAADWLEGDSSGKADIVHDHSLSDITQSGASVGDTPQWDGSNWISAVPPSAPVYSVFGRTGAVVAVSGDYSKSDVGLSNVDNTSDANKPVSTAQQTALNLKTDESITITGSNGVSGGGDLSANRVLSLDVGSVTTSTSRNEHDDQAPVYDQSAGASKKTTLSKLNSNSTMDRGARYESDFFYSKGVPYVFDSAGTGASTQAGSYGENSTENAFGVLQLDTGTTIGGRSGAMCESATAIRTGGSRIRISKRCALDTLSTGTQTFTAYIGFIDNIASGDMTNGCYFRYTDAVNGGRWEAVTSQASTRTATDTGVAADLLYSVFEVELDASGTSVYFYINGTLVSTNTTNIPSSSQGMGFGFKIQNSAGTGVVKSLNCDWYCLEIERSSAR